MAVTTPPGTSLQKDNRCKVAREINGRQARYSTYLDFGEEGLFFHDCAGEWTGMSLYEPVRMKKKKQIIVKKSVAR